VIQYLGCFVGHMQVVCPWWGCLVNVVVDGCETHLNGAAAPFHRGYFFGISVGMASKMSCTQTVATNRSNGMPILIRGPTNLAEVHGRHHPVNVAMWIVADEDDVG